jgi:hypothetical protein
MKKRIKKIKKKLKKLLKKLRVRPTSSLLIALFVISLIVALVGAVLAVTAIATPLVVVWWLWRQVFVKKQEQQSHLNSVFYQLLQDNCGRVTLLDFALKTNLTGSEAKQYLDQRAQEFMADFEVTQKGEIVYCFADLS